MTTPGRAAVGLLDTSTVILLPRLTDPQQLPEESQISTVTLAELSASPLVARSDTERMGRQARVQRVEADFDPLPFDAPAARAFSQVAADLHAAGRTPAVRAHDALVAAVAVANDLPLFTVNPDDFRPVGRLTVHPVTHPDAGRLGRLPVDRPQGGSAANPG